MMSAYTFTVKQGKTFNRRIVYLLDGQPFNLTDYEARMQIRPNFGHSTVYCTLSSSMTADGSGLTLTPISASLVLPRTSGSIGISISAYSSSLFTWTEGYYDLEIYSGSGVTQTVYEILRGKIKVLPEITKI